MLAAMAGMLTMSQLPLTPGDPIIGRNLELHILVGVIIGGVSFFGGRGSAIGAFIGVFFIQLVRSGLVIGRFDSFLQDTGARFPADTCSDHRCVTESQGRELSGMPLHR